MATINASILAEDFFRRTDLTGHGVVEAADFGTGFESTNLRDFREDLNYRPPVGPGTVAYRVDLGAGNDLEANMFFLISHNLFSATGGPFSYEIQFSDDDIAFTNIAGSPFTPTDDHIECRFFDGEGTHQFWRLRIVSATDAVLIGEFFIGRRIEFPFNIEFNGFDPAAENTVARSGNTEQGFITETTADYTGRFANVSARLLPFSTFLNDDTAQTGFRSWVDNIADKRVPFCFHWNAPPSTGATALQLDLERDAIFGIIDSDIARPMANQLDSGDRHLDFLMIGRKQ